MGRVGDGRRGCRRAGAGRAGGTAASRSPWQLRRPGAPSSAGRSDDACALAASIAGASATAASASDVLAPSSRWVVASAAGRRFDGRRAGARHDVVADGSAAGRVVVARVRWLPESVAEVDGTGPPGEHLLRERQDHGGIVGRGPPCRVGVDVEALPVAVSNST